MFWGLAPFASARGERSAFEMQEMLTISNTDMSSTFLSCGLR